MIIFSDAFGDVAQNPVVISPRDHQSWHNAIIKFDVDSPIVVNAPDVA
jgi:hypothetical protein